MTALKRELTKRGILHVADEFECMRGAQYDTCECLVSITENFIITVFHSAVLPSELHIYERKTLRPIGGQNLYPDNCFREREWDSFCWDA